MEKELWAIHVQGPDDLIAAPSQDDAAAMAVRINVEFAGFSVKPCAVVVMWPGTSASHAESLAQHWHGNEEDAFNAEQAKAGGMPYGTYGGY